MSVGRVGVDSEGSRNLYIASLFALLAFNGNQEATTCGRTTSAHATSWQNRTAAPHQQQRKAKQLYSWHIGYKFSTCSIRGNSISNYPKNYPIFVHLPVFEKPELEASLAVKALMADTKS
jgi:hypothetical protein